MTIYALHKRGYLYPTPELTLAEHAAMRDVSGKDGHPTYGFDGWRLDTGRRDLTNPAGERVTLTASEFNLLQLLCENPRQRLMRGFIFDALKRKGHTMAHSHSLDNLLSKLRRRLGDDGRLIKPVLDALWFCPPVTIDQS